MTTFIIVTDRKEIHYWVVEQSRYTPLTKKTFPVVKSSFKGEYLPPFDETALDPIFQGKARKGHVYMTCHHHKDASFEDGMLRDNAGAFVPMKVKVV